jgi:hypothetical protein
MHMRDNRGHPVMQRSTHSSRNRGGEFQPLVWGSGNLQGHQIGDFSTLEEYWWRKYHGFRGMRFRRIAAGCDMETTQKALLGMRFPHYVADLGWLRRRVGQWA